MNEIFIYMFSLESYDLLKAHVAGALPLNNIVVYSLPEGLWVFCITLTSKPYYLGLGNRQIDCIFVPLIFSVGLEILQLIHFARGRFDFMDIAVSIIFWLLGGYVLTGKSEKQNIFIGPNPNMITCLASYCIVYLAHVVK